MLHSKTRIKDMKRYISALLLLTVLSLTSCNDWLDRTPLDEPTESSVFTSYDNFKAYAWSLYSTFPGITYCEQETDNISQNWTRNDGESPWIKGNYEVPATASSCAWNYYTFIRKCNLLLDNIDSDNCTMSEVEKGHWRSVGLFFRSYRYFTLLSQYGGVPWIENVLTTESDENYAPRDTRDLVAGNILRDLQYAEAHIGDFDDGNNTIDLDVVQALMSRFTLFEGTWRKYHNLNDSQKYLLECKRVSADLISRRPTIHSQYDDLFNSVDLASVEGVLLYREYSNALGLTHYFSINAASNSATARFEPTRDMVDAFLCTDGQTRWNSPKFMGEDKMEKEFANRDRRMWLTVTPPFTVGKTAGGWDSSWWYLEDDVQTNGVDSLTARCYIDSLALLVPEPRQKTLPFRQGYLGGILMSWPHYSFMRRSQPWYATESGYNSWKYFACWLDQGSQRNEETDKPIFRIEETMLNYAEVMCELNQFDQTIADQTINVLRTRAQVAPMVVADIDANFDPKRDLGDPQYDGDYQVDPVLWEVRRERRVELFLEGFRFDDLRRWKKCQYCLKWKLGQWVSKTELRKLDTLGPSYSRNTLKESAFTIDREGDSGYLYFHKKPDHLWPEYYYLYPLPTDQLVLNPNLEQNPGWK